MATTPSARLEQSSFQFLTLNKPPNNPLITPISILANSHSGAADYADRWVKCISAAPPHPSGGGLSLC